MAKLIIWMFVGAWGYTKCVTLSNNQWKPDLTLFVHNKTFNLTFKGIFSWSSILYEHNKGFLLFIYFWINNFIVSAADVAKSSLLRKLTAAPSKNHRASCHTAHLRRCIGSCSFYLCVPQNINSNEKIYEGKNVSGKWQTTATSNLTEMLENIW